MDPFDDDYVDRMLAMRDDMPDEAEYDALQQAQPESAATPRRSPGVEIAQSPAPVVHMGQSPSPAGLSVSTPSSSSVQESPGAGNRSDAGPARKRLRGKQSVMPRPPPSIPIP